MTKLKKRLGQMAVAQIDSADAAFPGENVGIAFESNRTTGKDVHDSTGTRKSSPQGPTAPAQDRP